MKERPILFKGEMVRAILDGSKTQTRRVVKPQPDAWTGGTTLVKFTPADQRLGRLGVAIPCPWGQPGDRLWVRETWAYGIHALHSKFHESEGPWVYSADGTTQGRLCDRWRPSIHMFRAASRITLEITGVRVERLQDISEADAIAEGILPSGRPNVSGRQFWRDYRLSGDGSSCVPTANESYKTLWESINGPGSWDANPWVWVVEFKRMPL